MAMLFFLGAIFSIVSLYINITIISTVVSNSGGAVTLVLSFSTFPVLLSNGLKATFTSSISILLVLFSL